MSTPRRADGFVVAAIAGAVPDRPGAARFPLPTARSMSRYDDYSKDELIRLLQARDRRDATRFGLVWEANEIERDRALNADFVALDLDPALCYVPRMNAGTAREILKRAKGRGEVLVYTWQPGLLRTRLAGAQNVQVDAIPQSLARRFSLGG
jgi:hypothetical protein